MQVNALGGEIKSLVHLDAMDRPMTKDRDEKTGKYTETYPVDYFLTAIESLGGAAGTQEIAEEVGCAYRTAHAKLTKLEQEEKITSRKVGNAKLWRVRSND